MIPGRAFPTSGSFSRIPGTGSPLAPISGKVTGSGIVEHLQWPRQRRLLLCPAAVSLPGRDGPGVPGTEAAGHPRAQLTGSLPRPEALFPAPGSRRREPLTGSLPSPGVRRHLRLNLLPASRVPGRYQIRALAVASGPVPILVLNQTPAVASAPATVPVTESDSVPVLIRVPILARPNLPETGQLPSPGALPGALRRVPGKLFSGMPWPGPGASDPGRVLGSAAGGSS